MKIRDNARINSGGTKVRQIMLRGVKELSDGYLPIRGGSKKIIEFPLYDFGSYESAKKLIVIQNEKSVGLNFLYHGVKPFREEDKISDSFNFFRKNIGNHSIISLSYHTPNGEKTGGGGGWAYLVFPDQKEYRGTGIIDIVETDRSQEHFKEIVNKKLSDINDYLKLKRDANIEDISKYRRGEYAARNYNDFLGNNESLDDLVLKLKNIEFGDLKI